MTESIRLIGIDLDGTLLTTDKKLSPRSQQVLTDAIDAGVTVMVATGRPLNAIPPEVLAISGIRYVMASNGALIYDRQEERSVYHRCIAPSSMKEIWKRLEPFPYWKEVCVDGVAHVSREQFEHVQDYVPVATSCEYLLTTRIPENDMDGFMASRSEDLEKVCVFFREEEELDRFYRMFSDMEDIFATSAMWYNIELSDRAADKGSALRAMADHLGISQQATMSFGDNMNDMTMIRAAGIGVAMGNAHPELKAAADYVTLTNDEAGVADAIEKFVLRA